EKLKQLRDELFRQWSYDFRRGEFEQTKGVESAGMQRKNPQEELKAIIAKLQTASGMHLSPSEEQAVIADLKRVIESLLRPGFSITPYLESLIEVSILFFNANQPLFAAE